MADTWIPDGPRYRYSISGRPSGGAILRAVVLCLGMRGGKGTGIVVRVRYEKKKSCKIKFYNDLAVLATTKKYLRFSQKKQIAEERQSAFTSKGNVAI
jgi:hypothetical protein